jgi:Xaa-Pro aminopeptidase
MLKNRLNNFRNQINQKNIDGALIINRENRMYVSGFTGSSAWLFVTTEKAILVTDFRYVEQAQKEAPHFEIRQYKGKVIETLSEILKELKIGNLGVEEKHLSYKEYCDFSDAFSECVLESIDDIIEGNRYVKDEKERGIIRKAVEIADYAFNKVLEHIKPGVMEIEIAAEIEYQMKKQGASSPSFETIIASGYRASMPHGVASMKKLEYGDVITMDYGALYQNYCSDITRTVFLGKPNPELEKIYYIVLEAQKLAIEGASEGRKGKEVDNIARKHIEDSGYGSYFGHGLGHGVGLEIHEEPRLSVTGEIELKNYMHVTVEPGIYIPGIGGVRIEDVIMIYGSEPVIYTKASKELIVI